jgi:hypothetical protein
MTHPDDFDARLAGRFEQEHRHVPADAFVATTMRKVHAARRRRDFMRVGWRVAALVAAVVASPWMIAGVARVDAMLESLLSSAPGQLGTWVLGTLVIFVAWAARARSR